MSVWIICDAPDCDRHVELPGLFNTDGQRDLAQWAVTSDGQHVCPDHTDWSPAVSLGPHQTDTEVMQALGAARKWVCWEGFPYETCSPDNPRGCQFPEDCGWHWTIKADDQ